MVDRVRQSALIIACGAIWEGTDYLTGILPVPSPTVSDIQSKAQAMHSVCLQL